MKKVASITKKQNEKDSLARELLYLSDSTRHRLIANKVMNGLIRFLHLGDSPRSTLLVAWGISSLLFLAKVLFARLIYNSLPLYTLGSLLACVLISFSLAAVKILHDIILPAGAEKMLSLIDERGVLLLGEWFASFLSIRKQISFSLVWGLLAAASLWLVEHFTTASFDMADYILGSLAIACVAHGGYCGLLIPTIAKPLSKSGMKMFWLNPADSEGIKIASRGFRMLSMADAAFVTLCIVSLYWFKPWESMAVALISGIWLILGLLAVSYSFFYPHYYLNLAIKSEKERQLELIKNTISSYRSRIHESDESNFRNLSYYIELYERLLKVRESALDFSAFQGFITSLAVPTLSFLIGLLDLSSLVKTLLA